jgi:hypothetical protein
MTMNSDSRTTTPMTSRRPVEPPIGDGGNVPEDTNQARDSVTAPGLKAPTGPPDGNAFPKTRIQHLRAPSVRLQSPARRGVPENTTHRPHTPTFYSHLISTADLALVSNQLISCHLHGFDIENRFVLLGTPLSTSRTPFLALPRSAAPRRRLTDHSSRPLSSLDQ